MDSRQVHYFLTIVKTGSFSAAADELYISQSSLSKQIMALEKELGIQLFDRSKRQITLTEAGRIFLKYAHNIDEAHNSIRLDLEALKPGPESLSIVAIPVLAQYGIPNHIARFRETHPSIHFTLEEREGMSVLPALNSESFDLAFVRDNIVDKEQYSGLEISKDILVVVISLRNRFASRESLSMAELSNENFIMFDKGTILHNLLIQECNKAGFEPRIFYASLHIEDIIGLVASNIGIALMPEKLFEYDQHADVVSIPLVETVESNVVLVAPKNKKPSRAARTFIEFMERSLVKDDISS
jgi:LysR family transcriptional activator of glutamate synthase operon